MGLCPYHGLPKCRECSQALAHTQPPTQAQMDELLRLVNASHRPMPKIRSRFEADQAIRAHRHGHRLQTWSERDVFNYNPRHSE
jgi:hypothetical protein